MYINILNEVYIKLINKHGPIYNYKTTNMIYRLLSGDPRLNIEIVDNKEKYQEGERLKRELEIRRMEARKAAQTPAAPTPAPQVKAVNVESQLGEALEVVSSHLGFKVTKEDLMKFASFRFSKNFHSQEIIDEATLNIKVEVEEVKDEFIPEIVEEETEETIEEVTLEVVEEEANEVISNIDDENLDELINDLLGEDNEEDEDITDLVNAAIASLKKEEQENKPMKFYSNVKLKDMTRNEMHQILKYERGYEVGKSEFAPLQRDTREQLRWKIINSQKGYKKPTNKKK